MASKCGCCSFKDSSLHGILEHFLEKHPDEIFKVRVRQLVQGEPKYVCLNYGVSTRELRGKTVEFDKDDYTLSERDMLPDEENKLLQSPSCKKAKFSSTPIKNVYKKSEFLNFCKGPGRNTFHQVFTPEETEMDFAVPDRKTLGDITSQISDTLSPGILSDKR